MAMIDPTEPLPLYFGGRPDNPTFLPSGETVLTPSSFFHFVATVWVNQNVVPTELPELAAFDLNQLWPEYRAFIQSGRRNPERGVTPEEQWLLTQLALRVPVTCLFSSAHRERSVSRISRFRRIPPEGLWMELKEFYADPALERPWTNDDVHVGICPVQVMVYDGSEVAHCIVAYSILDGEIHFQDPWPTTSLLCAEKNDAGVAARESNMIQGVDEQGTIRPAWRITTAEFERVVYAVLLFPPPTVPRKSPEEYFADQRELPALDLVRWANRLDARPIEGMRTISRLEFAAKFGRTSDVRAALVEGADPNVQGDFGTPLHNAAENGHLDIVKLLLENGADHHARDPHGKTPAEVASENGHEAVAEFLLSQG